jgi:hypothetical protein
MERRCEQAPNKDHVCDDVARKESIACDADRRPNSMPVHIVISEIVENEMKRNLIERIKEAREALEEGLKKAQQELQIPEGNVTRARKAISTGGVPDEEVAQRRLAESAPMTLRETRFY